MALACIQISCQQHSKSPKVIILYGRMLVAGLRLNVVQYCTYGISKMEPQPAKDGALHVLARLVSAVCHATHLHVAAPGLQWAPLSSARTEQAAVAL